MQKFVVKINSQRIISTWADNKDQARKEAFRQLSKPGRRGILKQWQQAGSVIEKET